jgi:predicted transcriptional regulator
MGLFRVEDIMKTPVYMIDQAKTGEEAIEEMASKGVKKILVTSQGKPIGVLEKWKITEVDRRQPIKRLELSPFQAVPVGTELSSIQSYLREFAAVYVFDPKNPQKFVGVVTAFDYATAL